MNEQPNNETITQSSSRDLQIIEDDAFSYEGYQVVRGEFFAHTYEPSFTFNANKVSVNTACIKKLPQTDFVQILVNPMKRNSLSAPVRKMRRTLSAGALQPRSVPQDRLHAVSSLPRS